MKRNVYANLGLRRTSNAAAAAKSALALSLATDQQVLTLPTLKAGVQETLEAVEPHFRAYDDGNVPLRALQERTRLRAHSELKDVIRKYEELRSDLLEEKRARRNAQVRNGQLERQVQQLLVQKRALMDKRLNAESALKRSEKDRVRLADKKRVVEMRFDELLQAYRKIVKSHEALKQSYKDYANTRQMTTTEHLKRIVTSVFARPRQEEQEELGDIAKDKDGDRDKAEDANATSVCMLCKAFGLCNGFRTLDNDGYICTCGHREADHS